MHTSLPAGERFRRTERIFFFLIVALNLIPVLSVKFFTTLDGPSHLYNAQLIKQLATHHALQDFVVFNSEPVPNWSGHFILAFSDLFLPAFLSEKVLFLFYLIGLPLAFRTLVRTISGGSNLLISYLIFPFTYSSIFFFGFLNFCVALVFLFIALNFWIRHHDSLWSKYRVLKLCMLLTLIYFSHVSVFVLALVLAALYYLLKTGHALAENTTTFNGAIRNTLRTALFFLIAAAFPLLLMVQYFLSRPADKIYTYIPQSELVEWLLAASPATGLNPAEEKPFSRILSCVLALLIAIVVLRAVYRLIVRKNTTKATSRGLIVPLFSPAAFWLYSAAAILLLFFNMPDGDGRAGVISARLCLLFFLTIIAWLSTHRFPFWVSGIAVIASLYSTTRLHIYRAGPEKDLEKVALSCHSISEKIPANSIVYPLNYTDNWLFSHYNALPGIDKPLIIFDNYECQNDFFPLRWNRKFIPDTFFRFPEGTSKDEAMLCQVRQLSAKTLTRPDYIFMLGDINSQSTESREEMKQEIAAHYMLSDSLYWCKLYRHR